MTTLLACGPVLLKFAISSVAEGFTAMGAADEMLPHPASKTAATVATTDVFMLSILFLSSALYNLQRDEKVRSSQSTALPGFRRRHGNHQTSEGSRRHRSCIHERWRA